ncbi:eukaryotic translation initiation factor 2-alpha kinase 3-like isoform X2 [Dendronephthya gigantea]|nr:eukaryotic translation initiation factor 2-alpha kinase 3-like isoform X2 [Dendronephthya gigantea]
MTKWKISLSDEPLLSSSLSSVQMQKEFTSYRLIPSLNGGLYQFTWDSIEAMPWNADTLLRSSFKFTDGTGMVGSKNVQHTGIDPKTGQMLYSCSDDGCDGSGVDSLRDILVLKRTQRTIRAVNERTGAARWNFSVGEHKLSLLKVQSDIPHHYLPEDSILKQGIQVSIPERIVAIVQKSEEKIILWKKFDTPVAAVWILHNGVLEEMDLLKISVPPHSLNENVEMPLYYIGSHEDQLYIHPSDKMKEAVRIAIDKMTSSSSDDDHALVDPRKRLIWKPYLATSSSRTPAIVGQTELSIRQRPLEYPFDNGQYFFVQTKEGECLNNITKPQSLRDEERGVLMKLKNSVFKWWRELLIFVFTFGFFTRQIFKYWRSKHSGLEKKTLTLNLPCGDLELEVRPKCNENKAAVNSPLSPQSPENFVSRYELDFDHETCLGSGAFGLVFQARNKLDDCQYAVKRIRLPNNQKAREKVMREVKVLASLEHPGIVRYYNSWCEETPVKWLREWDDKLQEDSKCPTINTASPSYTSPSSNADMQLQEMSLNDQLSDYERRVDITQSRSRLRHDTITVENEDSLNDMEWSSGRYDEIEHSEEADSSFDVAFERDKSQLSTGNNNGRKIDDESSGVVFRHSSAARTETSPSNQSGIEEMEAQTSVKGNSPSHLLYIQMQLCRKDSLKDWLVDNAFNRNFSHSIDIFRQLVVAVDYIHQKGHIHRDLKPSNILFALDGTVKVGDFGLVAACQSPSNDDSGFEESTRSSNQNLTGQVGTQLYASPEQEAGTNYCFRADIFSLGIIFFELFHIFETQMERLEILKGVRRRNIPDNFTEEMPLQSELAVWLLAEKPSDRPSAHAISKSQLFSELLNKLSTFPQSTTTTDTPNAS